MGLSGTVFVHIALRREEQAQLAEFEAAVQGIPEVMDCHLMTGEFDYLLRVVIADMADFERRGSIRASLSGRFARGRSCH